MARRLFYPKEEILSKDFNTLRNDYEKLFLERFLGNSVPRIPAFIGGGFKPELNGNQVNVEPGIGLQRINQTDGSSSIRLMALESEQTLSFVLPSVGVTKTDIIQARSVIVNDPNEDRNFKVGASIVDRTTTVSQRWSAEVQVKQNVTPDAQGNYDADIGWVAVAIVTLNSTGITSLQDARDFYNLFDPDFFSIYGRKNVSFHKAYDGVNLIEVPFEFSDLVDKIDQVSVRRVTKERYGERTVTSKFNTNFAFTAPVSSVTSFKSLSQLNFLGRNSNLVSLSRTSRTDSNGNNYYHLNRSNARWAVGSSFGEQDIWGFDVYINGPQKNGLLGSSYNSSDFYYFIANNRYWGSFIDDLTNSQFNNIPTTGIYIILLNSSNYANVSSGGLVWNIPKRDLYLRSENLAIARSTTNTRDGSVYYAPIYKGRDFDSDTINFIVTTVNPLTTATGEVRYLYGTGANIASFHRIESISYNPSTQELKWTLSATLPPTPPGLSHFLPIFPSGGAVFDKVIFKKGTERRLSLNYSDLTVALRNDVSKVYADYTYTLSNQDSLIKNTDTSFTDFNIEFEKLNTTGEEIWRANPMRGGEILSSTVDFKLEEEGLRTYVRLNGTFPFKSGDTLIFSHIVPQELIDAGAGGTPEDQDLATQLAALRATVASNTRNISTNTGDISVLENASQAGDITFYYGILGLPGGRTAGNKANAKDINHLQPLAQAEFNSASERTAKTISSITLGGGLITFNAGATVGYYSPWVAIESSNIGTGSLYVSGSGGDESSLWRPAGTVTLNSKEYSIYVRTTPIINGKNLKVIFKVFE